jgi:FlaA1/EpsC-like NDP-sugar epimerase
MSMVRRHRSGGGGPTWHQGSVHAASGSAARAHDPSGMHQRSRQTIKPDHDGLMAGRTVLITGGTGGIGKATALGLATMGAG